ncbi:MAG: lipoyl(octanoyl) transferase LipB [Deltaproteobacteria bacterium]|nr:lipoyl(octanoyl) transferase LipB [Deltaproteobacteria bacterium]
MIQLEYIYLSKIDYKEALIFQKGIVQKLKNGKGKGSIIFLEHNDVITRGIRSRDEDLLANQDLLIKENINIEDTDRGGALTAHGPGQLVVYTIFDLKKNGLSLDQFIDRVIESFTSWLKNNKIDSYYNRSHPGIYVNNKKILSFGLKLDDFITYHGFALNLNSVPKGFKYIVPCSSKDCIMTSVYLETSQKYDIKKTSIELYNEIQARF